ncbi:TetR/AcrR family transcriptional regulator [Micromonospora sp. NPDC005203]|uniref:TetR/AcrR family transcriptional regulator n=1 Tax=Micromonospora sp. NPDC005203 TaxID=3364226 RepID=UPI00367DA10D
MPRPKDPEIRTMLIARAAHLLRVRKPVTLRSLVAGTGVSTMTVYTYFGGMDGLWGALRQEGFRRLADRLEIVTETDDPIRDLTAMGAAYVSNAVADPDLYRVMFDDGFKLDDPAQADGTLLHLVHAIERAKSAGRLRPDVDPSDLATQSWAIGHGLTSLITAGPLPLEAFALGAPMLTALYVANGDEPGRCSRSVTLGWSEIDTTPGTSPSVPAGVPAREQG